jgi:class 3 adenylate cyclase/predicted ATPase
MHCSSCGFDNPEGMKFCGQCGTKLGNRCPQCDFENPLQFKFCGECGTPLTTQPQAPVSSFKFQVSSSQPPVPNPRSPVSYTPKHLAERILAEQAAMEARGALEGERKTITALFADIKGSMELIEDLDPEEARAIVDPTLQLMMDAVHRYEGYVAQPTGDGIFALFGAPIAHEDHAQRALYTALRMQEEARRYADKLRIEKGAPIQIRVGLNTGEVVVRSIRKDDLHTDYVPVGHSTGVAARMESLASPGSIVVSEHTHKLTDGYFQFKALGAVKVKGVSDPLNIYEVLGVGPLRTRLQVAIRRGLAKFVGRQNELAQLQKALEQAKAGHGQIVGVMGEPGVGKSRLFYEFKLLSQPGCLVLETFSVSHGKAYPYLPVIDLLKNYFQITLQDDERKRQEKITGKVLTLDRNLEDTLPYLFFLLGLAEPHSPLQQMDSQIRRQRTLEAIRRLLVRESLNQPLILVFEDLHWLDAETQAFLVLLSESVATAKILLLVNYRPEYRHEWGRKTFYTQLRLDPLGQAEAEEMLTTLLEEKLSPLPSRPVLSTVEGERARVRVDDPDLQSLKKFILTKTEGNPFFMEEIVQELFEQGVLVRDAGGAMQDRPDVNVRAKDTKPQRGFVSLSAGIHPRAVVVKSLTDLHIPPTVQAVLMARIDRLPSVEKALLQTLAVIGKEFSFSLLRQVVDQPEEELQRLLFHLQDAEFIYEQPTLQEVEYTFKHALTQEVAYGSLLQERRKGLHERTAQAIETLYRSRLDEHYSELAYHYSRSGNTLKAVEYLKLAGQQAVQHSANAEAITHLTTALELLKALPDTPERTRQELTLQIALGEPLRATKGYGAPEIGAIYTRALELCQQIGETPQLFSVLWGLWYFYVARAEYQMAQELGRQCLTLAHKVQDPALLVEAHFALGLTLRCLGELTPAQEHFEQGVALYDPLQHHALAFLYSQDPKVASLSNAAMDLWDLGYPDQALQRIHDALTLAQELSHPFSLAYALVCAAFLHQLRREGQVAQERAEALIALCSEQGFSTWLAYGTVVRGWVLAEQGQGEEGITQMCQGLAAAWATGIELGRPSDLAELAAAYGKVGQAEEGLKILAEALTLVDKTGERWHEAELYRIKGELSLQSRSPQSTVSDPRPLAPDPQVEAEAEACFLKAIEIARKQQAKSLELRATMSLARLWQQQGKQHAAHDTLAEIYGWFTEGFDTADLQEAKALLAELS